MDATKEIKNYPIGKVLRDIWIFTSRKLTKYRSDPGQLFFMLMRPVLLLFVFSILFAKVVSGGIGAYQEIITPGMIIFAELSAASTVASMLGADLGKNMFDRLRTMPISHVSPLAGSLLAEILQYFLDGVAMVVLGIVMGYRPQGGFLGVLLALLLVTLFTWSASWLDTVMTLYDNAISGSMSLILMALIFLSNAFVPIKDLPVAIQVIATVNPVTHAISAFRIIAGGGAVFNVETWITLAVSVAMLLICVPLSVRAFDRKMN